MQESLFPDFQYHPVNHHDKSHLFYDKNVIITGELPGCTRQTAIDYIRANGGIYHSCFCKSVDILIIGLQKKRQNWLTGKFETAISSKQEHTRELIGQGRGVLELSGDEFVLMMKENL